MSEVFHRVVLFFPVLVALAATASAQDVQVSFIPPSSGPVAGYYVYIAPTTSGPLVATPIDIGRPQPDTAGIAHARVSATPSPSLIIEMTSYDASRRESARSNRVVLARGNESLGAPIWSANFSSSAVGSLPAGFGSGENFRVAQYPAGNRALGVSDVDGLLMSRYTGNGSAAWEPYELSGRMLFQPGSRRGGVGVRVPLAARVGTDPFGAGFRLGSDSGGVFVLQAGSGVPLDCANSTSTGVSALALRWYQFRLRYTEPAGPIAAAREGLDRRDPGADRLAGRLLDRRPAGDGFGRLRGLPRRLGRGVLGRSRGPSGGRLVGAHPVPLTRAPGRIGGDVQSTARVLRAFVHLPRRPAPVLPRLRRAYTPRCDRAVPARPDAELEGLRGPRASARALAPRARARRARPRPVRAGRAVRALRAAGVRAGRARAARGGARRARGGDRHVDGRTARAPARGGAACGARGSGAERHRARRRSRGHRAHRRLRGQERRGRELGRGGRSREGDQRRLVPRVRSGGLAALRAPHLPRGSRREALPDYDPAIAEATRAGAAVPADLWGLFEALAPIPTLAIRGELSDILSDSTLVEMARRKPDLAVLRVANRGHAPTLDEPECVAAIESFLLRISAS